MIYAPGKADQGVVRRHNASIVLHQLRLHAPLSRADLAKRIGLKPSHRFVLYNGPIECRLLKFELY